MKVTDRVVLITGASSGVGAALASKLSAMGARVVVNYSRSAEAAEAVVAQVTRCGWSGDCDTGRCLRRGRLQTVSGGDHRALWSTRYASE